MSHTAVPLPAMETCHQAPPPAAPGAFSVVDVLATNFQILASFKKKKKIAFAVNATDLPKAPV